MPHHLALTVAAYLCCVAPPAGFDPGPQAAAMTDPARTRLATRHARSTHEFVTAVLDDGLLGRDLAARPDFSERVAELIDVITRDGPRKAAAEAAHAGDADRAPLPTR